MNKTLKMIAIVALLSTMAASCQKEEPLNCRDSVVQPEGTYTVRYSINGILYMETFVGEEAWAAFMEQIFTLTRSGYEIYFSTGEIITLTNAVTDVSTYKTDKYEDAYAWSEKKVLSGYTVRLTYNSDTKVYTCIAIK